MPPPMPTDTDDARLPAVVRLYRGPLERYATHLLGGDHARGQDAVQDTFQRLLQQPTQTRDELMHDFTPTHATSPANTQRAADDPSGGVGGGGGRLKAWLFTVCRNRALDIRRKERRMTPLTAPLAGAQTEPAPGPDAQAQQHDSHAAVLRQMTALPANQQEVLRLRFHGELTYTQIAEVTGLTVGNVGYLLHHALKTMRQQLA
ncbi:MAG: sigma-70 family RNA polymerase sigma factor [Planctomycetota bacterium]